MEVRHIGQGSPLAYMVYPVKSWVCFSACAFRMATNSACPLISYFLWSSFTPSATTFPSFTRTAPKGSPPSWTFCMARSTALFINLSNFIPPIHLIHYIHLNTNDYQVPSNTSKFFMYLLFLIVK